jgi:hypothetical protein
LKRDGLTAEPRPFGPISRAAGITDERPGKNEPGAEKGKRVKEGSMDGAVLTAVGLVGAYAGYLIGLLVRGRFIARGGGAGGEERAEPPPDTPSGTMSDFDLWELEVDAQGIARA